MLVDAEKSQIGVQDTESDRGCGVDRLDLRQLAARLLFAHAQRFLGLFAFGDVDKSGDRQDPAAFRIIDRRGIYREEGLRPVAAGESYLLALYHLSGDEGARDGILFRPIGTAVRTQGAVSRVSLIVVGGRYRAAQQRLRFVVLENHTPRRRFGDHHADGHLFKNPPQTIALGLNLFEQTLALGLGLLTTALFAPAPLLLRLLALGDITMYSPTADDGLIFHFGQIDRNRLFEFEAPDRLRIVRDESAVTLLALSQVSYRPRSLDGLPAPVGYLRYKLDLPRLPVARRLLADSHLRHIMSVLDQRRAHQCPDFRLPVCGEISSWRRFSLDVIDHVWAICAHQPQSLGA